MGIRMTTVYRDWMNSVRDHMAHADTLARVDRLRPDSGEVDASRSPRRTRGADIGFSDMRPP